MFVVFPFRLSLVANYWFLRNWKFVEYDQHSHGIPYQKKFRILFKR